MSEKEKEMVIEDEREMVDHCSHWHPLMLVETRRRDRCYSCDRHISSGEQVYGCSIKCGYTKLLHEECAELPRKIRHALHPQHILNQEWFHPHIRCLICQYHIYGGSYRCTSAGCRFRSHIQCALSSGAMDAVHDDDEQRRMKISHPSHPEHELKFVRRRCSFKCDACGTTGARGSSYTCTDGACEYWIHQRCASLPPAMEREDHDHALSLSFRVPPEYIKFDYRCYVCSKYIMSKYWIYHCELCRYVVHLSCAFKKSPHVTREKGIVEFPISDVAVGEDLIGAFLRRQRVDAHTLIPHQDVDYKFHHHKLTLVSSSSSFQEEVLEEENSDDDDEEDYSCRKSELICDGCITPIFVKHASSSSSSSSSSCSGSSSSKDYYYYVRCSIRSCKYYHHLACFRLPTQLSSLPLIHRHDHSLCNAPNF